MRRPVDGSSPAPFLWVVVAVAAVATLRLIIGPLALLGVAYVVITAVTAWRLGPRVGLFSAIAGFIASQVVRFAAAPGVLLHPSTFLTRQYVVGLASYTLLSAIAILVARRHWLTIDLLESTRSEMVRDDRRHREQLEAALARETAARLDAEQANVVREQLVSRLSQELQRASELAAIVEWSQDAIVGTDLASRIVSWNRAAEVLFGYPAHEAVGRPIYVLIPPDRHDEERQVMARIGSGETVLHFETVRRRRDGSDVPISLTVSPIRDGAGDVIGASKIARDITQRRAAEAAIANLQTRLVALTAASGVLLQSPRVEDVVSALLEVARDLLPADGYAVWRHDPHSGAWQVQASDGVSARFVQDSVPDRTGEQVTEPLAVPDVSAPSRLGETRRRAYAEEGIRSVLVVPLVTHGTTSGTTVFYYRTPRQFAEPELMAARAFGNLASAALTTAELYDHQQRSRLESEFLAEAGALLASSLDYGATLAQVAKRAVPYIADFFAVDLVDEQGALRRLVVEHVDPARVELAELFRQTYPEEPESRLSVMHAVRTGTPVLVEWISDDMLATIADPARRRAVEELGVRSFMIAPMVARDRGVGAITCALVSDRRRYGADDLRLALSIASRAALAVDNALTYDAAARASRLKDEFLATLSHELRTPLNAVVGYARMVNSGMLEGDRLPRALSALERNATALTRLVEDVLDVSRFMTGKVELKLQPVDVAAAVDQAVAALRPAADAKGVTLARTAPDTPLLVQGDPDRLQQVVWNLLSNAVKFTPGGGGVAIEALADGGHAEIVVTDTGPGIAPEFMPHLFERFRQGDARFTREHGGLGLGLAIARDLVQLHGGTIAASRAARGRGAQFRVRLPLLGVAREGDDSRDAAPPAVLGTPPRQPGLEPAAGGQ